MTIIDDAWCASTPKRRAVSTQPAQASGGLKSVGSALDVLECFAVDGSLGVSDIARRLGIAKSTAHRLLSTLASRGFIEQDPETGQYRLGIHLFELGQLAQARNSLRHVALPVLNHIASVTGLTVNFAVPDGADVVFIERIETIASLQFLGHSGRRLPAHCTSSGKVLAAFDPETYAARLSAGFPPRLSGTVRTPEQWREVIARVRKDGYAVSTNESFDGASSVAVPVIAQRRAIASVSVFGPSDAILPNVDRLVPLLTASARRIALAGA